MVRLNLLEETRFEKLPVKIYPDQLIASAEVARRIAAIIKAKNDEGKPAVLGLATGATPVHVYKELVRMYDRGEISFQNVITFNLDEYYPMDPDSAQSYVAYMNEHLFNHVDIDRDNIHIPDGRLSAEQLKDFCLAFEQKINECGGIDLQLLGIGRTGHIGFNEPGSAPNSGTRLVSLNDMTRQDATRAFGNKGNVPAKAITMGIGTIFKAREIILLAWTEKKASIIRKTVEGEISSAVPATYLQLANNIECVLDQAAASGLTRFDTPWLVKDCNWTDALRKKAVIWLSQTVRKPILKLTEEDYNTYGMAQLITQAGPAYNINIEVFNQVQHTITGWPGGKASAGNSPRPERALPEKKRVIIFSPHPDDDVISMGGTFIRLVDQGHEVHVAYQTSGNTAVWDNDVLRFLEFAIDLGENFGSDNKALKNQYNNIREFFDVKKPKQADIEAVRTVKGLVRKGEAIAGARFAGVKDENIHFQNLVFYDQHKKEKETGYQKDVQDTVALIQKIKPHQIFAAGDFADPHGTHKICFDILLKAMHEIRKKETWAEDCWVWLYRGAWHEFKTYEIEMAVPLSPDEVERKRLAIFKHQSQKDRPVFPGDDAREFWVRAEKRNQETANAYNQLGFAEYEAMEAFVRWKF